MPRYPLRWLTADDLRAIPAVNNTVMADNQRPAATVTGAAQRTLGRTVMYTGIPSTSRPVRAGRCMRYDRPL
jgi:hypothetical protein